jgi:hypothetical protein
MDNMQLRWLVDCLVGWKSVGAAENETVSVPVCAEAHAFLGGYLGEKQPRYTDQVMKNRETAEVMIHMFFEAASALRDLHPHRSAVPL